MENSQLIWKNQKELRTGYTTGSCAAAAAKAAARMLLAGGRIDQISLTTPKGVILYLDVLDTRFGEDWVSCAIKKDSGDDPDVTDGVYVYARVSKSTGQELVLAGGEGIGTVTKKGLEQEIGQPAINKVPCRMIREAVAGECEKYQYHGGMDITISIPAGRQLAEQTFNPRLGIVGGISVLGTTGIVEPMSEQALTDTILLEMKVLKEAGHDYCYVVPGNYGSDFLAEVLGYDSDLAVKCSNYVGEVIDIAVRLKMKGILFVGHAGKMIKIAAGIMNTHSRQADGRMEVLAAHAGMAGASPELISRIMESITTEEAVAALADENMLTEVMGTILQKIEFHLWQRAGKSLETGMTIFTLEQGILGTTTNMKQLQQAIQEETR